MKVINKLLGINDSYQAPAKLMEILYDKERREKLFMEFLGEFNHDVSYDWFHTYFQNEHADRMKKKQDFTPNDVSDLLSALTMGDSDGKGTTYDCASGTGGITIRKWYAARMKTTPLDYKPSEYLYVCEELSDRAIPFLLFNMIIRGMNAIVVHCDVISRKAYGVFFIQNENDVPSQFSSMNVMPYSKDVEEFLSIKFVEEKYPVLIESKGMPEHLAGVL